MLRALAFGEPKLAEPAEAVCAAAQSASGLRVDTIRTVQPEFLDGLPQDSFAAQRSRRDLRIINRLLGSTAWFSRVLRDQARPGERVLEIGAGMGELGRSLSRTYPELAGLDYTRRPMAWPGSASWFETDVFRFGGWVSYPIVIGNLVFHHFDHDGLAILGEKLNQHARLFIASEPRRTRRAVGLFSFLCVLIRAHPVTRHDGRVSIAAGFRGDELPRLLQLDPKVWIWRTFETWLGAYRLVAERRS